MDEEFQQEMQKDLDQFDIDENKRQDDLYIQTNTLNNYTQS
jgi:hypothetical protein